jgi:hypothetical protein
MGGIEKRMIIILYIYNIYMIYIMYIRTPRVIWGYREEDVDPLLRQAA